MSGAKRPVYHRQRLLLYFLENLPVRLARERGGISKRNLQKLLLLYCKDMGSRHYDFVPWDYGGYSFQCDNDLNLLEKQGWIKTRDNVLFLNQIIDGERWALESKERETVRRWIFRHPWRGDELVARTYRLHPYYALHSKIKEQLLNAEELARVERSVDAVENDGIVVFTLGYEGIHFETYLNKLISNRVAVLCDVRCNPLSYKFGFSAPMLSRVLPKLNLEYRHFPELGILSEKRQSLHSKADYEVLFNDYCENLTNRQGGLKRLRQVIESKRRVALTCFEANHLYCHRHCISDLLKNKYDYKVEHL